MPLWCDKYRPTKLKDVQWNKEQAEKLRTLVKSHDFPHLLFYGPSGAGKKTRVTCLLREIFGVGAQRMRIEHKVVETASKKIEVQTLASNFHIEINPSDYGFNDRIVIQEMVKQHASVSGINSESQNLKVVVIVEADKLSKDAQQALRRTMEKYQASCRLILTAEISSRLLPAIKSRTLMIRVAAPTIDVLAEVLVTIAKQEGEKLDVQVAKKMAQESRRNARRAIMMAETFFLQKSRDIPLPRWQSYIKSIAGDILRSKTVSQVDDIRNCLYHLQAHLMPTEVIFELLVRELLLLPEGNKQALVTLAAHYEHQARQGSKAIIHLEAFVLQYMAACKNP